MAREKIVREARKKGQQVRERTLRAADYVGLFCTLQDDFSTADLFDLFRFRWQVELAFKRLKSITDFGHLPKRDPTSCGLGYMASCSSVCWSIKWLAPLFPLPQEW